MLLGGSAALAWPRQVPQRHVVEIKGMAYHPAVIRVGPGDTITWVNRDLVPHTATARKDPAWTTESLAQGQEGALVAPLAGELHYYCALHPVMRGRLIVAARPSSWRQQ